MDIYLYIRNLKIKIKKEGEGGKEGRKEGEGVGKFEKYIAGLCKLVEKRHVHPHANAAGSHFIRNLSKLGLPHSIVCYYVMTASSLDMI